MAKTVPVAEAVGMVLPHDITEIRRGEFKGRAFRKGHIIRTEDIEHLQRLGKEHVYILELGAEDIHEDEAARRLAAALAGPGVEVGAEPVEGKINLTAATDGLLRVNREALYRFNLLGEVMCATLHGETPVKKGQQVAATRLIPLVGRRKVVEEAVSLVADSGQGTVRVEPWRKAKAGLVITGNEVYQGRVKDAFEPVLRDKLARLGSEVIKVIKAPDDAGRIAAAIEECLAAGADLIVTSGGMSVDPDDLTREGIARAGAREIVYGTPVLPGAMFLVGYIPHQGQTVPVMGLPACGMFHRVTVFDLILPRVLAGEKINRQAVAAMGHGGLCLNCPECRHPVCPFGKG